MNKINQLQKELSKKGYNIKKASEIKKEEIIRTGIFALDYVCDGGIRICEGGHRIEFWGAEGTGKTTFSLHIIKKYQELNKTCVFIDAENSYDVEWANKIGVDNNNLVIIKPSSLEEFGDLMYEIIPKVNLIVIDSIISLIPKEELERNTDQPTMALSARINALISRKIYSALANKTTTLIFINQLREKVGQLYGDPFTSGGGHALRHLYNTRIQFKLGKSIIQKDEKVGYEINLRCIKNKKGKPYRTSQVDVYLDGYIDNKKSLFYSALKYGIIKKSGSWFEYNNIKEQGKEALIKKIKDWNKIEDEIWRRLI